MIGQDRFDRAVLMARLEGLGVVPRPEELEATLRRLELAFVLGRDGSAFRFRVPLFQQIFREEAVYLEREVQEWRRSAPLGPGHVQRGVS